MPITIPSKNIYGPPKINRIKDNKIETVEFKHFVATRETQKDTSIGVFSDTKLKTEKEASEDFSYNVDDSNIFRRAAVFSYSQITPYVLNGIRYSIPMVQNRKTISNIYYGKNSDGEYNISVSISGKKKSGTIHFDGHFPETIGSGLTIDDFVIGDLRYTETSSGRYENFDQSGEFEGYTVTISLVTPALSATSTPSIGFDGKNRGQESFVKNEESGKFKVSYETLYGGYKLIRLGGKQMVVDGVVMEESFFGEYEEYIPTTASISVNGNMIVLNLQEATASYGNGSNPYAIDGNELMQDTTFVSDDDRSYAKIYSERILEQYKNGKGTAEINCSIFPVTLDDSTESLVIPIGSSVIPMYMKPNGEDAPTFANADGTLIPCRVVGAEVYYDGATMQRLTIKEM